MESNSDKNRDNNTIKVLLKRNSNINIVVEYDEPVNPNIVKTTILLIIDSYGWAFDNISKNVKQHTSDYNVIIVTYPHLHEIIKNDSIKNIYPILNHILFFWYAGPNLEILDYFYNDKKRYQIKTINLCIYDYSKWINTKEKSEEIYKNSITYFFNKIDNYLYGCNFIKKHVCNTFPNKMNGYKIFDGVDVGMFPFFGYAKNTLSKTKLIVGWIGNSNPQVHGINKGFETIKKCVESIDSKFIFLPLDIHTSNKVIKHENVHCYLSLIDIIICYSMYEGTPNQILEASSCGKCWISTNVGIVEELQNTIKDKPCGIIIDRTEKDLHNALELLYHNRNTMIEYGKNGRVAIEHKWSWEKNAKQFYDFFDKVSLN